MFKTKPERFSITIALCVDQGLIGLLIQVFLYIYLFPDLIGSYISGLDKCSSCDAQQLYYFHYF